MDLEIAVVLKADAAKCFQHLRHALLVGINPPILQRSNIEIHITGRSCVERPRLTRIQRLVSLPHLLRATLDGSSIALRLLTSPRRGSGKAQNNQRRNDDECAK